MADRGKELGAALRELGKAILAGGPNDQTLLQSVGWNAAPLDKKNLAQMADMLAQKIEAIPDIRINKDFSIQPLIDRIEAFKTTSLPYLWNGNGAAVVPSYVTLLNWIDLVFTPVYEARIDWEKVAASGVLPKTFAAKLRSYKSTMDRFDVDIKDLEEKIKYIEQAHDAANALPTDLEDLRAATEEVVKRRETAETNETKSVAALEKVEALLSSIQNMEKEATKLVENTEDAYSAATTKGLGEAFQQRADRLSKSMWTWVIGLMIALGLGAYLGAHRVEILQRLVMSDASNGQIWLNLALAFISVAAPVWFAWLATKQIGHRFRLSEDYAFKASVARAYEGYRREAARLDPNFANRLFKSALDRLDEPPIRFVEHETFGSPFHEIFKMRQKQQDPAVSAVTVKAEPSKPVVANSDQPVATGAEATTG